MGVRVSKHEQDALEGSEWLRSVVQLYWKKRNSGSVARFESFTIEPAQVFNDEESEISAQESGIRLTQVKVCFRNSKEQPQEVKWIVKSSAAENPKSVAWLQHEVKINSAFLPELKKFLLGKKNPRAKLLLNIPDFIHQESGIDKVYLVLENVIKTKKCQPLSSFSMETGLTFTEFKTFLGTLAQFHAVGLAYSIGKDPQNIPHFLHKNPQSNALLCDDRDERDQLFANYERILKLAHKKKLAKFSQEELRRRIKLLNMLKSRAESILGDSEDHNSNSHSNNKRIEGLCLGPVLPCEVMFQVDQMLLPVCAAVNTCHRVHWGNIIKEVALSYFTLASPDCRRDYLIFLLQSYCFVLTSTLEVLDVDWLRHFRMTFPMFLNKFYSEGIVQAVIRAIAIHMRLTDPHQVDQLGQANNNNKNNPQPASSLSKFYIPLTDKRILFLVSLTDSVHKAI